MAASTTINSSTESALRRLVIDQRLATSEEIDQAEKAALVRGQPLSLPDLLLKEGLLTPRQLERVLHQAEEEGNSQIPGYQILSRLGAGAMASVFKARQISLDRIVAIKVMPKAAISDPAFIERFYAEGRAAAKLNHPNIVQAIDVGKAGDYHYFVMEYVEGHTVDEYLAQYGKYDEKEALRIIIQITEALRHAHQHGFIHRDVKPKNIMITKAGVAKLADMGLARSISDLESAQVEAGKAFGTPHYISPEQIRGLVDVDFRADIYGLGATFYHMITGRVPFDGSNPSAVMHKHLKQELIPPDHVNRAISTGAAEIIEVMLAKDRDKRYPTTAALLEDLQAVAAGNAPQQARRKIDMAHLADIENSACETAAIAEISQPVNLYAHPIFWALLASLAVNAILIAVLLLR